VRLLLDAHISGRRVGDALRRQGHDVFAVDDQRHLDGCSDEELLGLAAEDGRLLVTFDVKDFARITRRWAEAQRSHAGCAILVGMDHSNFGAIIRAVAAALAARPGPDDWRGYTAFVSDAS
jgi:predicted nuclease of predicted toxin-antitoxin system